MNERSQMQGGKNWILPKEINAKPVLLRLPLAGNLEKQLISLWGTEWRKRSYGVGGGFKGSCGGQKRGRGGRNRQSKGPLGTMLAPSKKNDNS
jgi:hypothetical protein